MPPVLRLLTRTYCVRNTSTYNVRLLPVRPPGHAGAMTRPAREGRDWLRVGEVARILHVSPRTVTRWADEGKIPIVRTLGGHRRFSAAEIADLAARMGLPHGGVRGEG